MSLFRKPQHGQRVSHSSPPQSGWRSMLTWIFAPSRHARSQEPTDPTDRRVSNVERDIEHERTQRESDTSQMRQELGGARRELDDLRSAAAPAEMNDVQSSPGDDGLAY
jgi:hypothetical protein